MKKIVIRVICFNQEDVIQRALDSVLCQKEWGLYKIIISDDCSTDRTWEILQQYVQDFPDIVEIHRNEHNLGIYSNVDKLNSYMPENYDLLGELSGDDAYCDGYFEAVQKLIEKLNIDTSDAIGIYSDWKTVYPNGKEVVHKQNAILSGYKLWSLKARGIITGRSLLYSKKVKDAFEPMLIGRGLNLTESQYDSQPHLNISKAFYLSQVTSIYYTGIGVSKRLDVKYSDYLTSQLKEKWIYGIEHYVKDDRDMHYAKYQIMHSEFFENPKLIKLFKLYYHYLKGQLPGCRNSKRNAIHNFAFLLKYLITR